MIKFKLSRDHARMIDDHWFPYMKRVAVTNMLNAAGNYGKYLNCKIIISLLADINLTFKRKLLGNAVAFTISFSEAEASVFYVFLMQHPIPESLVFARNLRQKMCDYLYSELFADVPSTHEPPPFSESDIYQFFEEYEV